MTLDCPFTEGEATGMSYATEPRAHDTDAFVGVLTQKQTSLVEHILRNLGEAAAEDLRQLLNVPADPAMQLHFSLEELDAWAVLHVASLHTPESDRDRISLVSAR